MTDTVLVSVMCLLCSVHINDINTHNIRGERPSHTQTTSETYIINLLNIRYKL